MRFFNINSVAKHQNKRGKLWRLEKFSKQNAKSHNFEQSHKAKNLKETLWDLLTFVVAKYQKTRREPLGTLKNFRKKNATKPKRGEVS